MKRTTTLLRALGRRCLRCGARGIFTGYFALGETCPRCDLPIEREDGYWVGALIVNIAVAMGAYAVFLVGGLVLFWPDPPYPVLLVGGMAIMGLLPVLAYPWSKTAWWSLDTAFIHPPGEDWSSWEEDVRAERMRRAS
jgi:uncharacterized protein (DUF983 family)